MPKSGTIVLFDRKMLRNFRKDGYNWKKKKDGKTIKEAHEHLKITFVRRCYWLLDKSLEQIVLVHYRETKEVSLATHSNSSLLTNQSTPLLVTEEFDSGIANTYSEEPGESVNVRNHEMKLLEINTLEWDELLVANDANNSIASRGDNVSYFDQQNQMAVNDFSNYIDDEDQVMLLFNRSDSSISSTRESRLARIQKSSRTSSRYRTSKLVPQSTNHKIRAPLQKCSHHCPLSPF
ncbi:hypothetical protein ES332_D08G077300v1 [Gossypium tomentosum]|uniref:CG-1 domain-containing protein n=1 Tax=Gossypium tomentosum TaxID=34277 RepID=A0A5D2JR60_GOSTO|nr:hypothetical protein ES332_D08G077300v1 [Gossypium tomentosum]